MKPYPMRTALFVPAIRPDRIDKALASGADAVIVDLEDAVDVKHKDEARILLNNWLSNAQQGVLVRINSADTKFHKDDIDFLRGQKNVRAIVLPKAETSADMTAMQMGDKPIWPIIETAQGLNNIDDIAACAYVERLAIGFLDLAIDFGWDYGSIHVEEMCTHVRFKIGMASRLHNLQPPIDGIYPNINDEEGLKKAAEKTRDVGFSGMLCIHPKQIDPIHKVYQPSNAQIKWAEEVIFEAKKHTGAFSLNGKMIDAPVIKKAHHILSLI